MELTLLRYLHCRNVFSWTQLLEPPADLSRKAISSQAPLLHERLKFQVTGSGDVSMRLVKPWLMHH